MTSGSSKTTPRLKRQIDDMDRQDDSNRRTYATFKQRLLLNKHYTDAIDNARHGHLHELFMMDHPQFQGNYAVVCAGFLAAHWAIAYGLDYLYAEHPVLCTRWPAQKDWRFDLYVTSNPNEKTEELQMLEECQRSWLNWSPILLDMHNWANWEKDEVKPDTPIPKSRTIAQCLSILRTANRRHHLEGASMETFTNAMRSAFNTQTITSSRLAMALIYVRTQSCHLAVEFQTEQPTIRNQEDLDAYLAPLGYVPDPTTNRMPEDYIGRGFGHLLSILHTAAEQNWTMAVVGGATLKSMDDFTETMNLQLWFHLITLSKEYLAKHANKQEDALLMYMASRKLDGDIPATMLSRDTHLKFFDAMNSIKHTIEKVPLREIPSTTIPFHVFQRRLRMDPNNFVRSVLCRLAEAQTATYHYKFSIGDI